MATIFASKAVVTSVGGAIGGGTANSAQPVINGTAAAGTYVNVYDGVRMIGTATVAANGTWTFTVPASLKGGNHSFTAIDVGSDGNFGSASTPMSVIIPASAPVVPPKPVINGMTDDQGHALTDPTNDAHPWINGTGVAGDTIALYDGNTPVGSATIGPDGQWKVKPTTDLSNGTHDLYVVDTSPAGVPSPQSDHKSVTIDTSVPATPSAPTVTDDSGAAIVPGVPTNDAHPHIDGKGVAGDIITVYDGNTVIGSTKVDGNGNWSFTPSPDLSDGTHNINVTETNAAGTPSAHSPSTNIEIDTSVPASPTIESLTDNVGPITGPIPFNGTTDDPRPVIKGTGDMVGDKIVVYDGATVVGQATVDRNGLWSLTPGVALADGTHNLYAVTVNAAGTQSAHSNSFAFTVDTNVPVAPVAPEITGLIDAVGAITGPITNGMTTDDPRPTLNGKGTAGDVIKLYDGATLIGSTVVKGDGTWSVQPNAALANGAHDLYATETNAGGTSPHSADISFKVDTSTPATPSAPVITDGSGAIIAPNVPTNDPHPDISGKGTPGDIITVYDGPTMIGSTTVDGNGDWTFRPSPDLTPGAHDIYVIETNPAGTSSHSNTLKLSLTDVLNLGETDLFQQDGKQQMMVQGKEGDVVDLSNSHIAGLAEGEWEQHGTTQVGGVTYNVYEHSGAHTELLVQQGVQIAVH
ncbi:hemolysin-type calcium-binding region [Caballeronia udeis]|uniref:Hemolysin-type calcium-binding region n=1 Tax=Caballeronia udeis TaxID=1232866 RepID=A0A158I3P1_9BURK|nr:Ig-like domain-containing protein [Caballeronia udeis]SAL51208.1 hemolysin-type calcium-binding region [Caballeronia udeis]